MCTLYHVVMDGHDYTLRTDAQSRKTTITNADNEEVGTIETSPCGEYFIAENSDNPLGMAVHHHIGHATLEDVAYSVIAGSY